MITGSVEKLVKRGANIFDEILDARTLELGSSVALWRGSLNRFAATQAAGSNAPVVESVSGVNSVLFTPANTEALDFDWPRLLGIAQVGVEIQPITIVTVCANTGLNSGSGRIWAFGSDTLNSIGLNLRQSTTGLRLGASDNAALSTVPNVFLSNDGESQRSICTVRINANLTFDAWIGQTQTITASPIRVSAVGYSGFNRFTIGARRRFFSPSIETSLYDDCSLHGIGFMFGTKTDAQVADAIGFMARSYGV